MGNDLLTFDPSTVWRPSSLTVLNQVLKQNKYVKVLLTRGFDDKSLPVMLTGTFANVSNNLANFLIKKKETPLTEEIKAMIESTGIPEASIDNPLTIISFVIDVPSNGVLEPTKYTGVSSIVKVMYNSDTADPFALFLHVNNNLRTRRIRKDTRYPWNPNLDASVGLEIVANVPQTKSDLRAILTQCATGSTTKPQILNISAGGVCLIPDLKFLKISTTSLFFFLLTIKDKNDHTIPFFLLMKKLGLFSSKNPEDSNAVRFLYRYELDWTNSSTNLVWNDIEKTGSDNMRSSLGFLLHPDN